MSFFFFKCDVMRVFFYFEDEMAMKRHMKSGCFHSCCQRLVDQCLLPLPVSTFRLNHSLPHRQQPPIRGSSIRSDSEHKVTKCNVAYQSNKTIPLRYVTLHKTYIYIYIYPYLVSLIPAFHISSSNPANPFANTIYSVPVLQVFLLVLF